MHQIRNKHTKFKSITLYGYRLFYFHKNMYLCNVKDTSYIDLKDI